jgi:hypothetical protein
METREQAEFNMATSYLVRLNNLFYVIDDASLSLNAFQWYHALMTLFRELSTEMADSEVQEFIKLSRDINETLGIESSTTKSKVEISPQLYDKLQDFELRLRRILKTSGLQMRMQRDPSKALK